MLSFETIFELYEPYLFENNCKFLYQRKNCKKHGHYKKKTNLNTGISEYEIRIDKDDIASAKIYTFIHEFTHMYNSHLDNKDLTYAQKEYVAHTVAMFSIKYFNLEEEIKSSNLQQKWDINTYGKLWLKDKKISSKKIQIMNNQITRSIKYCETLYKREFFS